MQQPSSFTPPLQPPAPIRPWDEVLREIQRAWSEAYPPEASTPPMTAPVPLPAPRPPGC